MAFLINLLPLLEGWRENFKQHGVFEVKHEQKLVEVYNPGWILHGAIAMDNPDAILEVFYTGKSKPRVTPRMLWTFNMTQPTNHLPYTTKPVPNDENIYTVVYEPKEPPPFKPPFYMKIIPPPGTTVKIVSFTYFIFEIHEIDTFINSLQNLLWGAPTRVKKTVEATLRAMGIGETL